ncbi:MAG: hypothetical protein ACLFVS_00965 [Candidatus Acetothermia bacterium]
MLESRYVFDVVMIASPGLSVVTYNYRYEESVGRAMGLADLELEEERSLQEKVFDVVMGERS